jgi:hypothetical protein
MASAGGYGSIATGHRLNCRTDELLKQTQLPKAVALLVPCRFLFFLFSLRKQLCSCNRLKWKAPSFSLIFKIITSCKVLPFSGISVGLAETS